MHVYYSTGIPGLFDIPVIAIGITTLFFPLIEKAHFGTLAMDFPVLSPAFAHIFAMEQAGNLVPSL